ncbi:DUF397 domain-containing protein [Saccharothrix tamanrassetensis]|uniref:DUF397 domain-containing protein n=1 Tax=Saccharothrix tamanrassetensis TaxID=1051531 RepID=UPI001C86E562
MTLWRKSSRSADTANCVEVARAPGNSGPMRKSSYSNSTANCVEVGHSSDRVLARDSKNPGPTISLPATSWTRFLRRTQG